MNFGTWSARDVYKRQPLIPGLDSIMVVPNMTTSVPENILNEVSIYPNPASDYVKVNFGNIGNVTYKLEVSAMDGKTILTKVASGNRYTCLLYTSRCV